MRESQPPVAGSCSPEQSDGAAEAASECASLSHTAAGALPRSSEAGEALRTCQLPSQAQVRFNNHFCVHCVTKRLLP